MMRQWTIEVRTDFADKGKNAVMQEAVRQAAVHIHATSILLADGQVPQVVAYSDDMMIGHNKIDLLYREKGDMLGEALKNNTSEDAGPSDEMLAALRDMQSPR